jgi:hypothetical protein
MNITRAAERSMKLVSAALIISFASFAQVEPLPN